MSPIPNGLPPSTTMEHYDRDFALSPLRDGFEEVLKIGGHMISMKKNFAQVFPD